jgi:hypothetical protein
LIDLLVTLIKFGLDDCIQAAVMALKQGLVK